MNKQLYKLLNLSNIFIINLKFFFKKYFNTFYIKIKKIKINLNINLII